MPHPRHERRARARAAPAEKAQSGRERALGRGALGALRMRAHARNARRAVVQAAHGGWGGAGVAREEPWAHARAPQPELDRRRRLRSFRSRGRAGAPALARREHVRGVLRRGRGRARTAPQPRSARRLARLAPHRARARAAQGVRETRLAQGYPVPPRRRERPRRHRPYLHRARGAPRLERKRRTRTHAHRRLRLSRRQTRHIRRYQLLLLMICDVSCTFGQRDPAPARTRTSKSLIDVILFNIKREVALG
mmetsp:Transcript_20241/g.65890  ORF Transcript_20241/g.65890 Transcript_20241/m.65890 type:complete len:251 (+) Transcript_20241:396-1148(+)